MGRPEMDSKGVEPREGKRKPEPKPTNKQANPASPHTILPQPVDGHSIHQRFQENIVSLNNFLCE